MILYILPLLIGLIIGYMLFSNDNKLDTQIMSFLKKGKKVIICVDDDATIFEMNGNRIKITKAISTFMEEPIELPVGDKNELDSNRVGSSGFSESGNYNESGVAD